MESELWPWIHWMTICFVDGLFFQLMHLEPEKRKQCPKCHPIKKTTTNLLSSGHLALFFDKNWVYNLIFLCHKHSCSFILNWVYIVLSRFLISDARFRSEIHPVPHPAATGATPPQPGVGETFIAGCFFPLFFQKRQHEVANCFSGYRSQFRGSGLGPLLIPATSFYPPATRSRRSWCRGREHASFLLLFFQPPNMVTPLHPLKPNAFFISKPKVRIPFFPAAMQNNIKIRGRKYLILAISGRRDSYFDSETQKLCSFYWLIIRVQSRVTPAHETLLLWWTVFGLFLSFINY